MAEIKGTQVFTSAVLSGNAHEVAQLLDEALEQRTVAVILPDNDDGRAAEQVIRRVMEFLPRLIRKRQHETLNKLTDAFLAGVTPRRPANAFRPKRSR